VVGYSRLMAADEAGTLTSLKAIRRELVEPKTAEHHGRVVKLMGDGTLMEFGSVVDAVTFAVDMQRALAERNAGVPEDRRITYRIGINIGDIIVEGEDIYGDGVNVAARLEGLADPGGICVSRTVFNHVKGKVDTTFEDLGEKEVKNIAEPVRVYRVCLADVDQVGSTTTPEALPLPDKPSIAVLPFDNMSGDPEQEYFSDGITEDIITGLSRFSSLSVVARNSTFVYRDSAVNVTEAGKALGARYLLEGSLRKAGNRVRLTAQLIDVESGKHIWAERYDRVLEDIFAIQDELVHAIVATLVGRLETAHTGRALHKHPENLAAYDYYLKALQFERRYDAEGIREGRKALEKAVALDPGFAKAHALLANFIFLAAWFEATDDHVHDDEALAIARRAVELDPNDGDCYAKLAVVHLQRREFDQAQHYLEQALALNPHDSSTWSHYAWYLVSIGKPQQALDQLSEREAVEPFPPNWHWELRGLALYELGRYEEAASTFARMTNLNYWDHGFLCACYGQLGQTNKARAHWEKVLEVVPDVTAEFLVEGEFRKHKADSDHWLEGYRKAGLAE
jgi:TolB-like protein/cytochrome c-type biogenesis protein CcmH/NrfG